MRCKKWIEQSSNPIKHIHRERAVLWKHCWPDELPVWMGVSVCRADGRARHTAFTRHLQWDRMKGGAATVNRKQAIISAWRWKSIQEKLWSVVLCSLALWIKSTRMWKHCLCLLFVPFLAVYLPTWTVMLTVQDVLTRIVALLCGRPLRKPTVILK